MKNFIIRYYSQNGEDYILWKLFDLKKTGFFIDVGAFDGLHLSNTLSFEQQGWKGICIEANKKYFKFCKEHRNNSICLNYACIDNPRQKTVQFFSEELGLLSSTTHSKAQENDIKKRYQNRGLKFKGIKRTRVNATTLNNVLEEYKSKTTKGIDLVSIDVEGNELEVLRGFDIQKYAPRVIVVEANTDEAFGELDNYFVNANGYFFARRLNENLFYSRDIEDAKKISNIIIDCVIEKQSHPLGEKYTPLQFIRGHVIDTEKEELKIKLSSFKKNLIKKDQQINYLSEDAETHKNKFKEKEKQITNLSNDAESYKKQIKEKEQQVAVLYNDAESYKKQIKEKEQQVAVLYNDAESYKKQIKEKEQQVAVLYNDAESYKKQIKEKEQQVAVLYNDSESHKKQIKEKEQQVAVLYNDSESHKKQIKEKEQQVAVLFNDSESHKKQIKEKEQQVAVLFNDAKAYKKLIKEKEQQLKYLFNEAESYKEKIGDKDALIDKLINDINNIRTEKENIFKQFAAFEDASNSKFSEVISKIEVKDKQLDSYRIQIETLKKKKQDVHDRLSEIENNFFASQKDSLDKENQIADINNDLQKMEEQLKLCYQTLEYRQKELDAIYNSRTWKLMSFRNRIWFKIKRSFTE